MDTSHQKYNQLITVSMEAVSKLKKYEQELVALDNGSIVPSYLNSVISFECVKALGGIDEDYSDTIMLSTEAIGTEQTREVALERIRETLTAIGTVVSVKFENLKKTLREAGNHFRSENQVLDGRVALINKLLSTAGVDPAAQQVPYRNWMSALCVGGEFDPKTIIKTVTRCTRYAKQSLAAAEYYDKCCSSGNMSQEIARAGSVDAYMAEIFKKGNGIFLRGRPSSATMETEELSDFQRVRIASDGIWPQIHSERQKVNIAVGTTYPGLSKKDMTVLVRDLVTEYIDLKKTLTALYSSFDEKMSDAADIGLFSNIKLTDEGNVTMTMSGWGMDVILTIFNINYKVLNAALRYCEESLTP